MPTIYKTSSTLWNSGTSSLPNAAWSTTIDGAAPYDFANTTKSCIIGAAATSISSFGSTTGISISSLSIAPEYGQSYIQINPGTTLNYREYNGYYQASLYVAPNKALSYALVAFASTYVSSHIVYVDSGAYANVNFTAAGCDILKRGPGEWYTSDSGISTTYQNATLGTFFIEGGTVHVGTAASGNCFGTAQINIRNGARLQFRTTRTHAGSIVLDFGNGTIAIRDSSSVVTISGAGGSPGSGGVLTVETAAGSYFQWNNNVSSPLNVTGNLTMGTNNNLTGSTLTGTGTITMSGGTLSNNAPTFTGNVAGNFIYSGANKTFGGQVFGGVVDVASNASVTFTRSSHTGSIGFVRTGAVARVRGYFSGIAGGDPWVDIEGTATLRLETASAGFSRKISVHDKSTVWLTESANIASELWIDYRPEGDGNATVGADDATYNVLSGAWFCNGTVGSIFVSAKTGGTLEFSASSTSNATHTRPFDINGTGAAYEGTIKLTGTGFNNPNAPVNVKRGKLLISSNQTVFLGSAATIDAGATLACATPTGAYAAKLSGSLALASGATMRFGIA